MASTNPSEEEETRKSTQASRPIPSGVRTFAQTQAAQERTLPMFTLSSLEGQVITILRVEPFSGKFGAGLRVVVVRKDTGEKGVLLGHWQVIGKYLEAFRHDDELPVSVRVVKREGTRYFDFEDPMDDEEGRPSAESMGIPF